MKSVEQIVALCGDDTSEAVRSAVVDTTAAKVVAPGRHWGTSSALARSGLLAPVLTAGRFFTPIEQLQQVTGNNGEILGLSTWKDPYPHGDLGVIKEGAYADILLIDGDPTQDIRLLMDSANVVLIMKDGKFYKNEM